MLTDHQLDGSGYIINGAHKAISINNHLYPYNPAHIGAGGSQHQHRGSTEAGQAGHLRLPAVQQAQEGEAEEEGAGGSRRRTKHWGLFTSLIYLLIAMQA